MTELDPEAWKQALWQRLDSQSPEDQFVEAGEIISWITYNLLPDLGVRRRDCIVDLKDEKDWDVIQIAQHFGMRRSTVVRLLDEGRSARKQAAKQRALEEQERYRAMDSIEAA